MVCRLTLKLVTTDTSVTGEGEGEGEGKRLPHIELLSQLKRSQRWVWMRDYFLALLTFTAVKIYFSDIPILFFKSLGWIGLGVLFFLY